jgi:maltooligosyltrehalose trehalohydrolase
MRRNHLATNEADTAELPTASRFRRKYPVGAEFLRRGVHFRVWAPKCKQVDVLLTSGPGAPGSVALKRETGGYFAAMANAAFAGTRYRFRLDRQEVSFPDPASRFQPDGPHGDSEVIDSSYPWTDQKWKGRRLEGQVLYEMHVGTFTRDGTWAAAELQLAELSSAGITTVELMPVAEFPGRFGWGYDGVNLFAPSWLYGTPRQFRAFVDTAHSHRLAVILDVVYNHLGPDGNYLRQFSDDYFSRTHTTDWGEAINFDDENSLPVREFFLANATYWIKEFHLDGLRVDATQNIYDTSSVHILKELTKQVRFAARPRTATVIAENEPQNGDLVRPGQRGGFGMDAMWNDDFHHSATVALTGRNEAYYTDHRGSAQEFISAAKHGFLYQGQWYSWQKQRRGSPALDLPPAAFVTFIQNHDQIANSATGQRVHKISSPGAFRALTALLLLGPGTPMLFQGQEFAASAPFRYFSDHKPEISKLVLKGRAEFLSQFRSLRNPESQTIFSDPGNPATFEQCKLDFSERERHAGTYALHKDLLRLRREDPVFAAQTKGGVDGAILSSRAFVLRFFSASHGDRLLLVNLDVDLKLAIAPEPLLAPPRSRRWEVLLSTEDPKYGGAGVYPPDDEEGWRIPGLAALVLAPAPLEQADS